ncbi:MAG: D-alanyl-D-alanine endopeptidase [Rhodocyclaceae bacterium]|nr:D-alanyl-D-alanine endopeptidase [Rhodocyclaceae bacterium]
MKKTAIMLLAALGVALGPFAGDAVAAPKKKPATIKKHAKAKPKAAKPLVKAKAKAKAKARSGKRSHHAALVEDDSSLSVQSASALVIDQSTGAVVYEKNASTVAPIASITKLMTAMVALDAKPNLQEVLTVSEEDVDMLKGTRSRLKVGTQLSREEMLRLALMSSENRAASALSRHYPGGRVAFVAAMNQKAQSLGLNDTRFEDPTGLTSANVSSAKDLARMVDAAYRYPLIREFSTTAEDAVAINGRPQMFHNTNSLVKNESWEIGLSKTGYISEAGKCLVMQAWLNSKPTIIVLLDSWGKLTRVGDANRIKRWVESAALTQRPTAG